MDSNLKLAKHKIKKLQIELKDGMNIEKLESRINYIINSLIKDMTFRSQFNSLSIRKSYSPDAYRNGLEDLLNLMLEHLEDQEVVNEIDKPHIKSNTQYTENKNNIQKENKVFIIHGHDGGFKDKVALHLKDHDIDYVILSEALDRGKNILDKFESEIKTCKAAIVIYTPDDKLDELEGTYQARPNVLFEHGYAISALGRENVIMLVNKVDRDITLHSDIQGLAYKEAKDDWKYKLLKELQASGIKVKWD